MKRLFSTILVTGCIVAVSDFSLQPLLTPAVASTQTSEDLYYTYYGKRIALTLHQDAIAVVFKEQPNTRSSQKPLHILLQQELQSGTRGETVDVKVQPLGKRYALIQLPGGTRSQSSEAVKRQISQQVYVESTLPVLSRADASSKLIVLPNEIVVSFKPELNDTQVRGLLNQYNLDIVKALRFTKNRYVVESRSASGVAILNIANQLNQVKGVKSATPNFVQSSGSLGLSVSQANAE